MAETSANDVAHFIAMKHEVEDEMGENHGGSSSNPSSGLGEGVKDPRQTLRTMRDGTRNWYKHMDKLHETLHDQLEAVLASNLELFHAQEKKIKECQQLRQDMELKDAQIASLEEARRKDEDLAKEVMELKEAHAKALEERDLTHATEVSRLTEQLKALGDNLAKATQNAKVQQEKHAQAVQLAEETLASHMD